MADWSVARCLLTGQDDALGMANLSQGCEVTWCDERPGVADLAVP